MGHGHEEVCHQGSCCSGGAHEPSCSCQCCHHEKGDFAHLLLEVADEAWMEVLKEKIKDHIRATQGKQLDKLAKLVTESNNTLWKHKMGLHEAVKDHHAKVGEFFSHQ